MKRILNIMRENKGFTMLFSVLVSSLVLSIGLSIFNLTIKELVLSSSGRESQFAFYAADSGAECALYWDLEGEYIFATSSANRTPSNPTPTCASQNINIIPTSSDSGSATTEFSFSPSDSVALNSTCVFVRVVKNDEGGGLISTTISSYGYNMGYEDLGGINKCQKTDETKVERGLRIRY